MIYSGKKVMLFVQEGNAYKSIGFCTNHTLSVSSSTISVSHKDLADVSGGKWTDEDPDTFSWSITSEAFYANEVEGIDFTTLFNYMASGTVLHVKFGLAPTSSTGVPTGGWVPAAGTVLSGDCRIASIDLNAPTDEKATFSIVMNGKGALTASTQS